MKTTQIFTLTTTILLYLCIQQISSQVFIKYDQLYESTELVKFFREIQDGYFVDIGAFDPMTYSNTLFLYTKGWNGINIQASPKRYSQFYYTRYRDLNLNIAIGQNLSYATLYDNVNFQGTSTINPQVKQTLSQSPRNKIFQVQVPTITMSQLCHRYYQKQPNYMNLDIEGFSSYALLGNDWTDIKCKPEIFTVEINHSFDDSKIKSPQKILEENGYKFHSKLQLSEIWILGDVYEKYMKIYEKGKKHMDEKVSVIHLQWLVNALFKKLFNITRSQPTQLDSLNQPLYFHFPKQHSQLSLDTLNLQSNLFTPHKNRPILILDYNVSNTVFIGGSNHTTISHFEADGFQFTNITVKKHSNEYSVYVYGGARVEYVGERLWLGLGGQGVLVVAVWAAAGTAIVCFCGFAAYLRVKRRKDEGRVEGEEMENKNSMSFEQ